MFDLSNEAELAALILHELAHSILQHGELALKTDSWRIHVDNLFAELDQVTAGDVDDKLYDDLEASALLVQREVRRIKSLEEELAADSLALFGLVRCGYDPEALIDLQKRLMKATPDNLEIMPEDYGTFLRSKSEYRTRISNLERLMTTYSIERGSTLKHSDRFKTSLGL